MTSLISKADNFIQLYPIIISHFNNIKRFKYVILISNNAMIKEDYIGSTLNCVFEMIYSL